MLAVHRRITTNEEVLSPHGSLANNIRKLALCFSELNFLTFIEKETFLCMFWRVSVRS